MQQQNIHDDNKSLLPPFANSLQCQHLVHVVAQVRTPRPNPKFHITITKPSYTVYHSAPTSYETRNPTLKKLTSRKPVPRNP